MALISILLPNLNNRPFLEERLRSITAQTLTDWELIVVDGYSDDGAWELLKREAALDGRFRLLQAPRQGIYAAFNKCLEEARGEYVYFATSDDTMEPECLETMHTALDVHRECDMAHCRLRLIDADGNQIVGEWERYPTCLYFQELMGIAHIRHAPHDGVLHCGVGTVYTSMTQLLIRRSLFDRVGLFSGEWGPAGDFEWSMRAGFTASTVHVPEYLASWRIHPNQATDLGLMQHEQTCQTFAKMVRRVGESLKRDNPDLYESLQEAGVLDLYETEAFDRGVQQRVGWKAKLCHLLRQFPRHPIQCARHLSSRLQYLRDPDGWKVRRIRAAMERPGLAGRIEILPALKPKGIELRNPSIVAG